MSRNAVLAMKYMTEIEEIAEDILTDKQNLVGLDAQRNKTREAYRHVLNEMKDPESRGKSWLWFGNTFVQMPNEKAEILLERDKTKLESEIETKRRNLRTKVHKLREMEGKPELTGFSLSPLSREEMAAINQVLTGSSH